MARLDNPDVRAAGDVRVVADGLQQLRLTSASGLTVNVFVARARGAVAAIDLGFTTTTGALLQQLDAIGLGPRDLDAVIYTHTHEDHMGGGIALRGDLRGSDVVWEGTDNVLRENWYAFYERLGRWDAWVEDLLPAGPLRDSILAARARRPPSRLRTTGDGTLARPRPVALGEVVEVAGLELECVDARGHDPFHVAWLDRRRKLLFSGDVLLRAPTPLMPPLRDNLAQYRETLLRWTRLDDVELLLPGHGRPETDFPQAVARSLGFVQRLWEHVAAALGPTARVDPAEVAMQMLGDGDPRAAYVALANVHSQLEEFRSLGLAACADDRRWNRLAPIPAFESLVG